MSYRTPTWTGGIVITDGAHHNVFERIYVHDVKFPLYFEEGTEDESSFELGHDNIIRNVIINNVESGMVFINSETSSANFDNNSFDHITWSNVSDGLFKVYDDNPMTFTGNTITNSVFINIPAFDNVPWDGDASGVVTFSHNGWHDTFVPVGTDNLEVDPGFDEDFVPENEALRAGIPTSTQTGFNAAVPISMPPTLGARQIPDR